MKQNLLISLLVFANSITAQVSFKVSGVKVATDTLEEVSFRSALEARIGAEIESFDYSNKDQLIVPAYAHSFVAALHHCYADHRPMVISPDMIWLMICQGLAQHIELQTDSLREHLVNFSGKKTIKTRNDELVKGKIDNNWAAEFPKFTDSIKKYVDSKLYKLFTPQFSTTTKAEQLAYQITLMKAVDTYFEYIASSECGIPEIILEGTKKDWKTILINAKKLDQYGLQFWTSKLLPILKEFLNASKGKVNEKFWQSIYKWKSNCGHDGISGWILTFFPYYYSGGGHIARSAFKNTNIQPITLPTGIAKVNLDWIYKKNFEPELFKMEIYAGFIGIQQNKKTKAIKPLINWGIRDENSKELEKEVAVFHRKRFFKSTSSFSEEDLITFNVIEIEEEKDDYELDDNIYLIVEQMPEFPGGEKGLRKYINSNLKYPILAVNNEIEGKVYVRFCVNTRGRIEKISISRGIHPLLDKEAIRVVSSLPKWRPGKIKGKRVNVWYAVPVNFELNSKP